MSVIRANASPLQVLKLDLSLLTPVAGAITVLPLVAVFAITLSMTSAPNAIATAIGANLIAVVSLVGAPRLSIRLAVVDALALGISVFVGMLTSPIEWLHIAVLVPWCFVAGMMVVFGLTQATVGSQAIIAFVVLGRFAGTPMRALHLGLFVMVGALVEVLALVVLRLPPTLRYQRGRLANAYESVSELAVSTPSRPATDLLGALDEAELALSSPSLFSRTDVQDLRSILDQARRIRLELTTIAGLRVRLSREEDDRDFALVDASLAAMAQVLDEVAAALRQPSNVAAVRSALEQYRASLAPLRDAFDDENSHLDIIARQCVTHLMAIGGQLRSARSLLEHLGEGENRRAWRPSIPSPRGPDFGRFRIDASTIQHNLHSDSPAFRHAVRLAVAVPLSILIGSALSLPRSYWLPFAVAVILKPDYSTLVKRGVGRLIGTLLGATLAAVVVSELHPDLGLTVALVACIGWIAYTTWAASFSFAIGFITAMVLILLSTSSSDTIGTAVDRLIDISLGGAIAVIAYLAWPTSPRAGVANAQSGLFRALREYLDVVMTVVLSRPVNSERVTAASRNVRNAWAKAEAAVGRSVEEPSSTRIDPAEGRSLLATTMRILRATHALRTEAERGATVRDIPAVDALHEAFLTSLTSLEDWFADGTVRRSPSLRAVFQTAENALEARNASASIAAHLDELVNAINTATQVSGLASSIASN